MEKDGAKRQKLQAEYLRNLENVDIRYFDNAFLQRLESLFKRDSVSAKDFIKGMEAVGKGQSKGFQNWNSYVSTLKAIGALKAGKCYLDEREVEKIQKKFSQTKPRAESLCLSQKIGEMQIVWERLVLSPLVLSSTAIARH